MVAPFFCAKYPESNVITVLYLGYALVRPIIKYDDKIAFFHAVFCFMFLARYA
jgi:hypothetical protein